MDDDTEVVVKLTGDEAPVLFEWLTRFDTTNSFENVIEDQAEQRALWNLTCLLERELVAPFQTDYDLRVEEARVRLRDAEPPAAHIVGDNLPS